MTEHLLLRCPRPTVPRAIWRYVCQSSKNEQPTNQPIQTGTKTKVNVTIRNVSDYYVIIIYSNMVCVDGDAYVCQSVQVESPVEDNQVVQPKQQHQWLASRRSFLPFGFFFNLTFLIKADEEHKFYFFLDFHSNVELASATFSILARSCAREREANVKRSKKNNKIKSTNCVVNKFSYVSERERERKER